MAVLGVTLLVAPIAFADLSEKHLESQLSIDSRKQLFAIQVDSQGAEIADKLAAVYVYLHRGGADLTPGKWLSPFELERQKSLFSRGLLLDEKVRTSVAAWFKLFGSNLMSISDPLGENEALILSRDAYSLALLNSHQFFERLRVISEQEKFDFRPVVRQKIRELQFTSDGVFIVATGGVFGWAFKALGIVKAGAALSAVSASAIVGTAIWEFTNENPQGDPTVQEVREKTGNDSRDLRRDVKQAKENDRRLFILGRAAELKKLLETSSVRDLKKSNNPHLLELVGLRPKLESYFQKLQSDQLPIRLKEDVPSVRSELERALNFIFTVLDQSAAVE
jgi:hypothetical protein